MPAAAVRCSVEVEGGGCTDLMDAFRSFSLFVSHDNRRRCDPAIGIDRWATQCVSILMPAAALRCSVEVEGGGCTDLLHVFRSFSLFV